MATYQSTDKPKPDPLVESDEEENAPGTSGGIAALFQKRNALFAMSSSDMKAAEKESKKYLGKEVTKKSKKKSKKVEADLGAKTKTKTLTKLQKKKIEDDKFDEDNEQLELEANKMLGLDDCLLPEYRYGRTTNHNEDLSDKENQETEDRPVLLEAPITVIDEVDDEVVVTDLDDSQSELGQMVLFYISLNGERFSLMFYENAFIDEVRNKVAGKSGNPNPEFFQIFLENTLLEDNKTVKESGITDCCTLDVFIKYKSEQELFEEGSSAIIKLKLQTSDRRGRQNCFIYVKRTAHMREVRDKFAKEIGVNPEELKLESDGEFCSLDSTPEDCDLENDFVVDVTIANEKQEHDE